MDISTISNTVAQSAATSSYHKAGKSEADTGKTVKEDAAAVYEKSSDTATTSKPSTDRSAIVAQLKADSEQRMSQLLNIVKQTISKQGGAIGTADSMWQFLAGGNFTVDAETKAQAQADIAEDGYWGVEQTSDRIVDFAKALSGNDSSKAEELLSAFKKGFSQATKTWGSSLPDISQRTYDAVLEKFDTWVNGEEAE